MALTGVARKTSHLMIATYKEFGDPFQHKSQTTTSILTSLRALASEFDPSNVAVTGGGGLETSDYMLGTFRAHVHLSHNVTGG